LPKSHAQFQIDLFWGRVQLVIYMSQVKTSSEAVESIDLLLGNLLRQRREEAGLRAPQLAKQINVNVMTLEDYEAGLARVPSELLVEIAEICARPITDFFPQVDSQMAERSYDLGVMKTEAHGLIDAIDHPAQLQAALLFLRHSKLV